MNRQNENMKYIIKGACRSVVGNVRKNNEDNYYFNYKTLKEDNTGDNKTTIMNFENVDNVVCSVFDGMGGEVKGERASFLAASTLKEYVQENQNKEFQWNDYIKIANEKICNECFQNICNLGDSRIYGLNNKKLKQISKDHTDAKIQEKLNVKIDHKPRLTQYLGIKNEELKLIPYINRYSYNDFQKILICTDGLTDLLTNEEIEEIMASTIQAKEIVNLLVDKALEKGGTDNITVIVLEIGELKNINYKKIFFGISIILLVLIFLIIILNSRKFEIVKDEYTGPIVIDQSYEFEYKGNVNIEFSNDNIKYENGKIIAIKAGTTTITIKNKSGKILYIKSIKVFPK